MAETQTDLLTNVEELKTDTQTSAETKIKDFCGMCDDYEYIAECVKEGECHVCKKCQEKIEIAKKEFTDLEIQSTERNEMKIRRKCVCDSYTEWLSGFHLNYLLKYPKCFQCSKCCPDNEDMIYIWLGNFWNAKSHIIKCDKCKTGPLMIPANAITTSFNRAHVSQCENCDPSDDHIKFKFMGTGWYIYKVKEYINGRHMWTNRYYYTPGYKCNCVECSKDDTKTSNT